MQFSRAVDYAIHGLLALSRAGERTLLLDEIARTAKVPKEYLRKVFRELSRFELVVARRGVAGGYRLARRPSEITLKDIVDAVAGGIPAYACVAHTRGCGGHGKCPVHAVFSRAADGMAHILGGVTLESVESQIPPALPAAARR